MSDDSLNEQLRRKAAEVEVLRHSSLEINNTLDLEEIFDVVLRTMGELFDFHHSIILLPDASEHTLQVVASRGYEVQALGGTVAFGTGVIGMVAQRLRLMRVSNLGQQRAYAATIRGQMEAAGRGDELHDVVPVPGLPHAESQIAIPLLIGEDLVGVFSVESLDHRPFSDHDELLVTIVANQAASAIQNAQLYAAARERQAELASAHESLRQLNATLEDRVVARTEQLQQANRELRETQAQLVQSDKMASLGMLAAGIAHEINTPIGAIKSNSDVSRRAIEIINEAFQGPGLTGQLQEDQRLNRALKVVEDVRMTTLSATERVAAIVQSLKDFAHLDEAELQRVDIHAGIESTLTLIQHLLSERITVVRNFSSLPEVQCFASQINQVFMNLLTNAVQAIEGDGTISIATRREDRFAAVEVADTGRGIPADQIERVFDPGFTTKGVGVGVGLGLSISYRIIEDHGGMIEVQSEVGKGTKFICRLPFSPPS